MTLDPVRSFMKILGYAGESIERDNGGICHGIAVTGVMSYLMGNETLKNLFFMMHKIKIDPRIISNTLIFVKSFGEQASLDINPLFDEICIYLKGKKIPGSDVTSVIRVINPAITIDVFKFLNIFNKKEWIDVKTFFDNFCIFMGEIALPKYFFKTNSFPISQFKLIEHASILMGYRNHEIKISIEALFNEQDLKLVINKLIEKNGEKIFAMVIMLSNHTVCLGWNGKELGSFNNDNIKNSANFNFEEVIGNLKICKYKQQVLGEEEAKAFANILIFGRHNDKLKLDAMDLIQLKMDNAEKASLLLYGSMITYKVKNIKTCFDRILHDNKFLLKEKISLLKVANLSKTPILCFPLQNGNTEAVTVFIEAILSSKLFNNEKLELLSAKRGDGTPGLFLAFHNGHTEIVKLFTEAILISDLDNNKKLELLNAKRGDGTAGLYTAFHNGNTEIVKLFTEAILISDLDNNKKLELLNAKRGDGIAGLFMAFHNGHTEIVKLFTEAILISNLDNNKKLELLNAKRGDGTAGLYTAFHNGHTEIVKLFTEAILISDLDKNAKLKLLSAKNDRGTTGLYMAFHNNHIETVKIFAKLISESKSLDNNEKLELQSIKKTANEKTGLRIVYENGHIRTVTAFIKRRLSDDTTSESPKKKGKYA